LTDNVKRGCDNHHPNPELLAFIAKVISGEQDIEMLNQYLEWKEIP
jgi:hypothetical protein